MPIVSGKGLELELNEGEPFVHVALAVEVHAGQVDIRGRRRSAGARVAAGGLLAVSGSTFTTPSTPTRSALALQVN